MCEWEKNSKMLKLNAPRKKQTLWDIKHVY